MVSTLGQPESWQRRDRRLCEFWGQRQSDEASSLFPAAVPAIVCNPLQATRNKQDPRVPFEVPCKKSVRSEARGVSPKLR